MAYTNKSVSFNLSEETQRNMVEYAEMQGNFSAYVKELIRREMEKAREKSVASK